MQSVARISPNQKPSLGSTRPGACACTRASHGGREMTTQVNRQVEESTANGRPLVKPVYRGGARRCAGIGLLNLRVLQNDRQRGVSTKCRGAALRGFSAVRTIRFFIATGDIRVSRGWFGVLRFRFNRKAKIAAPNENSCWKTLIEREPPRQTGYGLTGPDQVGGPRSVNHRPFGGTGKRISAYDNLTLS